MMRRVLRPPTARPLTSMVGRCEKSLPRPITPHPARVGRAAGPAKGMSRRPASWSFPLGLLPDRDACQDVLHALARSCQETRVVRHDELEIPGQKHGLDFKNCLRNLRLGINLSGGMRVKEALPE